MTVAAALGPELAGPEAAAVAAVVGGRRALRRIYALARGAGSWDELVGELSSARDHLDEALTAVAAARGAGLAKAVDASSRTGAGPGNGSVPAPADRDPRGSTSPRFSDDPSPLRSAG